MNNTITYTREEIQNAINAVLRATYKYEAPTAFKIVERAGYETYKSGGQWVVRSLKTYKSVKLGYRNGLCLTCGHVKEENVDKVDIINYLDKPVNHAWFNELNKCIWGTPTQEKVRKLRYAKEDVARYEAEMEKLAKQLERARENYVKATKDLLVFKVKNGMKV